MNSFSIQYAVGKGMSNKRFDLMVVQSLLQLNQINITPTGIYDEDTRDAITQFQKDNMGMISPSGDISPGDVTHRKLEQALPATYELADSSVVLGPGVAAAILPLSIRFYCNSTPHRKMVITSGIRTSRAQAEAMFKKLEMKDDLLKLYLNKTAVTAVIDAYNASKKTNDPANKTIDDIRIVLDNQIANKVYISSHFNAKAFDVRSRDLDSNLIELFRKVSEGYVRKLIHEGKPPHLHLEMY